MQDLIDRLMAEGLTEKQAYKAIDVIKSSPFLAEPLMGYLESMVKKKKRISWIDENKNAASKLKRLFLMLTNLL